MCGVAGMTALRDPPQFMRSLLAVRVFRPPAACGALLRQRVCRERLQKPVQVIRSLMLIFFYFLLKQ